VTWFQCPHCLRRGEPEDAREGWESGDRDQPGYAFDACRVCMPSEEDRERAAEAKADAMRDEATNGPDGWR